MSEVRITDPRQRRISIAAWVAFGAPFISLAVGEKVNRLPCGCQLEANDDADTKADVFLCPMHAAAFVVISDTGG